VNAAEKSTQSDPETDEAIGQAETQLPELKYPELHAVHF